MRGPDSLQRPDRPPNPARRSRADKVFLVWAVALLVALLALMAVGYQQRYETELTDAQAVWCQQNLVDVALTAERLGLVDDARNLLSAERGVYARACRAAFELR